MLTRPGVEPYDSGDIIWFPPGFVNMNPETSYVSTPVFSPTTQVWI
eukprot:SAG22_NODE_27_length_29018_cov_465.809646_26_plen_46_part_00